MRKSRIGTGCLTYSEPHNIDIVTQLFVFPPSCLQDYVCEVDPTLYSSMSYTTVEISASLAAAQQQHMCEVSTSSSTSSSGGACFVSAAAAVVHA